MYSYLFVCILLSIYHQGEGCLDLLVRGFNEVFSPVIETADSRRENFHDVDEITPYYKRDKDGSLVLDEKMWRPPNVHWRRPKGESNDTVGSLFKQLNFPSARSGSEESDSNQNSSEVSAKSVKIEADVFPVLIDVTELDDDERFFDPYEEDEFEVPRYHPRGAYVPGRRPLLDIIVEFLEMFQVTAESSSAVRSYREKSDQYTPRAKEDYDNQDQH